MTTLQLTEYEEGLASGAEGEAAKLAMRLVLPSAKALNARRLQPVTRAHVTDALLVGVVDSGVDFTKRFMDLGARVRVPTTLNASSIDLQHPCNNSSTSKKVFDAAKYVMGSYVAMGCLPTYTCSPFQELQTKLDFGEHVAWGESNAVSFANSVFGARTNRYGHFSAMAYALAGVVPYSGLHLDENRVGNLIIRVDEFQPDTYSNNIFYHILGSVIGSIAGDRIPIIIGLPDNITHDNIKALGASAATTGSVPMYHIPGVTPEAANVTDVMPKDKRLPEYIVSAQDISDERKKLTALPSNESLTEVCLGAPHLSIDEVEEVYNALKKYNKTSIIPIYISISRKTLSMLEEYGWKEPLLNYGVKIVCDRCTYFPGILDGNRHMVMTDSVKWVLYGSKCLDAQIAIGSIDECIRSAIDGKVRVDDSWLY